MKDMSRVPFDLLQKAKVQLKSRVYRTPLIPLNMDVPNKEIYLKLENLQPVGSFKQRGACFAIRSLPPDKLKQGVFTASAGNFAQGLAWNAQQMGVPCTVLVPDNCPDTKRAAIKRYGGEVIPVPYTKWWEVIVTRQYPGLDGTFLHPVCEPEVIAGNSTMGFEIFEDLPDVDTVVVPWGGGGALCGIASALKQLKPSVKMLACEVETAAPLTAALRAGSPVTLSDHQTSFVDGMGGKSVLDDMWCLASNLVDDTVVLSLQQICDGVKLLMEKNRIVAEGAGAATVSAALSDAVPDGNIVCIISGGNIDTHKIITILEGGIPE